MRHLYCGFCLFALFSRVSAFQMMSKTVQFGRHSRTVLYAVSPAAEPGKLLYDAAVDGDVEKMKIAIKECKGSKDQLNYSNMQRYGRTPLVIACYYNQVNAVRLLLSTPGVDVNKGIDFGTTALMYAAHRGHVETVKVLLADRRTSVNARATGGRWAGKTALKLVTELRGYVTENSKVADQLRAKGAVV